MQPMLSSSKAVARLLQSSGRSLAVNLRNGKGSLGTSSGWRDGRILDRFAPTRRFFSSTPRIGNPWINDLVDGAKNSNHFIGNSHGSTQTRSFLGCSDGEEGNILSKVYEERRVLGYSPEQMFSVVAAVDMYEDFVPWCQRSKIIKRNSDGSFDAELEIGFKFLVESYVSHVEMQRPKYVKTTALATGLFDHLINIWEFNPGPVPGTCDLYFLVDFKFQSPLYRQVASMFFKEVVSRLVVSFTGRCQRIYGPAVQVLETSYGQSR